jgi:hypothetical protein
MFAISEETIEWQHELIGLKRIIPGSLMLAATLDKTHLEGFIYSLLSVSLKS